MQNDPAAAAAGTSRLFRVGTEGAPPPRVLVVEDERIVALELQNMLRDMGCDAYATAAAGADALALASAEAPDVALMDIRLKGSMDGIDTAMQLRALHDVEIVFLTAHADESTIERARGAEPAGYLLKPITAPALKAAVALSLDRRGRTRRSRLHTQTLERAGARMAQMLDNLNTAIIVENEQHRLEYVNQSCQTILGSAIDALTTIGGDGTRLVSRIGELCCDQPGFLMLVDSLWHLRQSACGDIVRLTDGRVLERDYIPLSGPAFGYGHLWAYRDVSERERQRVAIEESATHNRQLLLIDELTGLHSRRGFFNLAEVYLRFMRHKSRPEQLFFLDLNDLKSINDRFGHAVGDEALRDMANALRSCFGSTDLIARLSGDEFVVLCSMPASDVAAAKARLTEALRTANASGARPYALETSVGVAEYAPGESLQALLTRADEAMYQDKRTRKGRGESPG
jgi:diguanylate cyclase (GGDEF)-like protein